MAITPNVTCRRCRRTFSRLRSRCPYCGTQRIKAATQFDTESDIMSEFDAPTESTSASGAAPRPRSQPKAAGARPIPGANTHAKWQMIFGVLILTGLMVSVIAMISASLNNTADEQPEPSPPISSIVPTTPTPPEETATATQTETPQPSPTGEVTSITFTAGGAPLPFGNQFTLNVGGSIQLGVTLSPADPEAEIIWSSDNGTVATVDSTGLVTGTGAGWAKISVSCKGQTESCDVWVR